MKKLLLTVFALSILLTAVAAPKRYKLLTSTINWGNTANWSPTGKPQDGDTVFIPEHIRLTLSSDLTLRSIYFDLFGDLMLSGNNMRLILENASTLNVHTSGTITGDKASQQVLMGSNILFKGGSTVLNGPKIATSASAGFVPYIEFTILPVKFISFNVMRSNNSALVQWTTAEEVNLAYYEVQRSTDGAAWTSVATIPATSNPTNQYSYVDKSRLSGTLYYRIRQVDTDGTATFTFVRTLASGYTKTPVIISVQNKIIVQFQQVVKGRVVVEVIGLNGFIALQQIVSEGTGSLQLATSLKGLYIVRISNGYDLHTAKQVLL